MSDIIVIGAGASGVHFTLSLLEKGYSVTMLDVGYRKPAQVFPTATFQSLKGKLKDPVSHFLGSRFEGVALPQSGKDFFKLPPAKAYVFTHPPGARYTGHGFEAILSFAQGGLAEAWTAWCYPLNNDDLRDFPFGYEEIAPCYEEVAHRIGVTGRKDDLTRFFPLHDGLLAPLELDPHSSSLLAAYETKKEKLNHSLGCYMGLSRVATLSRQAGTREACTYLGRCFWGCPIDAIYTPSQTLARCLKHDKFTYIPNLRVLHLLLGTNNRIRAVVAKSLTHGDTVEFPVERLALAAGTLCSSEIILRTLYREGGELIQLRGLMDNRQVHLPFLNLRRLGNPPSIDSYQYHQVSLGLEAKDPCERVHCQITTLKAALLHPVIQRLPFDLGTSARLTAKLHGALGLVNVNFRDTRRKENYLVLSDELDGKEPVLSIHYQPFQDESALVSSTVKRVKKALMKLGCFVPPGLSRLRPMGTSVHYAGTIPMSRESDDWTTTEYCQSREFGNVFIVDGTTMPFLPAKNLTFTLMANAVRVARACF